MKKFILELGKMRDSINREPLGRLDPLHIPFGGKGCLSVKGDVTKIEQSFEKILFEFHVFNVGNRIADLQPPKTAATVDKGRFGSEADVFVKENAVCRNRERFGGMKEKAQEGTDIDQNYG